MTRKIRYATALISKFDSWAERLGKSEAYKKGYWFYITHYNYVGIGMGKFYNIRQVIGFYAYGNMTLLGIKEFFPIPASVFKGFFFISLTLVFWFWLLGRFIDHSKGLHLEAEWGNVRNPAMIELRKNTKKLK